MQKLFSILVILTLFLAGCSNTEIPTQPIDDNVTLQQGVVKYSSNHYLHDTPITPGYDIFGYNYQALMFNGKYKNYNRGISGLPPFEGDDIKLVMKWNEAWLSNKDCDGDGKLDRHLGYSSYKGSGAWLTNHMSGEDDGVKWTSFVKIVAVPEDAVLTGGIWYLDGIELGPTIWGEFAIVQKVESGVGILFISPAGPGFGKF